MSKYDAVLFDFDGTLYDTFLGIARSYQHALRVCHNREYPDLNEFRKCVGPPLASSFVDFYGVPESEVERTVETFRARYGEKGVLECEPYAGVREMLDRLKAAGLRLAISSSKPEMMIRKILGADGLLDEFEIISGLKSELDRHSTKTGAIREALEFLGVPPERAVMVGDRFYDAEGAQNVGVDFVAALYGFSKDGEFAPYPCICQAETTGAVADCILSANGM